MSEIIGLGEALEIIQLILSVFIGLIVITFLVKHREHLGKGAITLLIAIVFMALVQVTDVFAQFAGKETDYFESILETIMLVFFTIALLIETRSLAVKR